MNTIDKKVEAMWDHEASSEGMYATPRLNLTAEQVNRVASGYGEEIPGISFYPVSLLNNIGGKKTLCLASGGGQQTALLGVLGACVTCVDISEKQLAHDSKAAQHYGYDLTAIKSDMRDLSAFADNYFDLVYQPVSACFIPDLLPLYQEVYRVLRPGGIYCVHHCNPATYPASFEGGLNGWDGTGFRIVEPYCGGAILMDSDGRENMSEGEPTGEHRHLLKDIFGHLIRVGFTIEDVVEDPRHFNPMTTCEPGSHPHYLSVLGAYFGIVSTKAG